MRIFQPKNEKGESLASQPDLTTHTSNSSIHLSEKQAETIDVADVFFDINVTPDKSLNSLITNIDNLSPALTVESTNTTKSVTGKAVVDYVESQTTSITNTLTEHISDYKIKHFYDGEKDSLKAFFGIDPEEDLIIEDKLGEYVTINLMGETISGLREQIDEEYAPISHTTNTSLHFTGSEKSNLTTILTNYDGTTTINKLVQDITELQNSSGGDVQLPDDIECNTIVAKGYYKDCSFSVDGTAILGQYSTVSNNGQEGNIILGTSSNITGGYQYGNILTGDNFTITDGEQYGNIISGSYGNIANKKIYGNVILGESTTFENDPIQRNTWIVASLAYGQDIERQITTRYGLTLIGTGQYDPLLSAMPYNRYRVFWPNKDEYAAEQYGWLKCMDNFNLLNADGEYIIQNGKLVGGGSNSSVTLDSTVTSNSSNGVTSKAIFDFVTNKIDSLSDEYISAEELINHLEAYVTEDYVDNKISEINVPDTENLITKDEVAETYATKEELSALTPLVYGSFGFPNTTSGNYNLLVAILGDKFNPKHYGKLHSISLQCGDSLPANSNGHSTAGPAYMYIGKWSEETNTITDIIEVSTNYVEMTSNAIATWEFDSDADYSDTDKICFCLHSTNNKTAANVNQDQMLIRAKVGPYTDGDSYVWSSATNNQKGSYIPAFMARCEAFEGGQIQVVDYVEEHNHGVVTSNAVYKELSKVDSRISELEENSGNSSDIDTSNLATKQELNNHIGDYDTHWDNGEKSELYNDINQLQTSYDGVVSRLTKLENNSSSPSINPEDLYIERDVYDTKTVRNKYSTEYPYSSNRDAKSEASGFHIENVHDLFNLEDDTVRISKLRYTTAYGYDTGQYTAFAVLKNNIVEFVSDTTYNNFGKNQDILGMYGGYGCVTLQFDNPITINKGDTLSLISLFCNYDYKDIPGRNDYIIRHESIGKTLDDINNDEKYHVDKTYTSFDALYNLFGNGYSWDNIDYHPLKEIIYNFDTKKYEIDEESKNLKYGTFYIEIELETNKGTEKLKAVFLSDSEYEILSRLLKTAKSAL